MKCPSSNQIIQAFDGLFSRQKTEIMLKHVKGCKKCFKEARAIRKLNVILASITVDDNGKLGLRNTSGVDKARVDKICSKLGIKSPCQP
jgi:hypothetical protein